MKSENRDFLKSKLKDIYFSALNSYSFGILYGNPKVHKTIVSC